MDVHAATRAIRAALVSARGPRVPARAENPARRPAWFPAHGSRPDLRAKQPPTIRPPGRSSISHPCRATPSWFCYAKRVRSRTRTHRHTDPWLQLATARSRSANNLLALSLASPACCARVRRPIHPISLGKYVASSPLLSCPCPATATASELDRGASIR